MSRPHLTLRGASPALALALLVSTTGCPSASHRITRGELIELAQKPPEARGERVRVVQSLGGADEPPSPAPRVHAGVSVYVAAPIWVDGTPRHHGYHGPSSGYHGDGGGSVVRRSNVARGQKEEAKAWLIVAGIVAGALAFTEGVRYDGWVKLHPMQPLHLWGPYGDYTWMPLAELTPEVAEWADHGAVRSDEGPWQPLGRAPLDRRGFSYSFLLGAGQVPVVNAGVDAGFLGRFQIGFFPSQIIGIQADIAYNWTQDDTGADIFDGRYSLELDALPFRAGAVHAGGYGQIGLSSLSDDGVSFDDVDALFGGGGLLQLELTTRLALTVRAGVVAAHDEGLFELTGGVSIY
ncbi:MAG TPA: hypothetical protein VKB80_26875 [Kofleriaceae bacterium]|nr:hypothetical protein [Kofleriaceae bacterium]